MRTVASVERPDRASKPTVEKTPIIKLLEALIVGCLFLIAAFAPNSIAVTQGAWLLGMLFWVVRLAIYPRPVLKRTPLDYAFFGFFILSGLSSFLSYEPFVSIGKLRAASLFTIVYLVAQNIPSRKILRLLALVLIASGFASVIYTVGERALGRGVKVQSLKTESPLYLGGIRAGDTLLEVDQTKIHSPEDILKALTNSAKGPALVKTYRHELLPTFKVPRGKLLPGNTTLEELGIESWSKGRDWRATGLYGQFVTYAEALQLILALTVGLLVALPGRKSWVGLVLTLVLVGLCYALMLTVTRASWFAFLVSTAVIILLGASRRVLLVLGLLAIPVVLAGLFILQQQRNVAFIDQRDQSTTWRQTVWREGFQLLISKPRHLVVGVGMDSIKGHWREWGMFDNGRIPWGHMHSNMLQLALERGVPTLIVWLILLALYVRMLFMLISRTKPESKDVDASVSVGLGPWIDYGLTLGALGGLVGFFVSGLVHYNWGDSEVIMIFYFIMGMMLALNRLTSDERVAG
jgi:hypothetical protein